MNLNEEHMDELIAKYLAGEALPDEAILLDEWKSQSEANLRHFNEAQQAWKFAPQRPFDAAGMFKKITAQKSAKVVPLKRFWTPLRFAASLILVSLLGMMAIRLSKTNSLPDSVIVSTQTVTEQKLADGSQVALNKNSKLTVVGGFNSKTRKVKLEGEAFFEVVHDAQKPFTIEAGGLLITDIGTAFNVNAKPESDSVVVSVTEGIVELKSAENTLVIRQSESVVYLKSTKRFIQSNTVQPNIAAYKTKQFHFNGTSLAEVVASVNAVYGDILRFNNSQLASCTISVDFINESPETIATIIAQTLGLHMEQQNGVYVLSGSGCNP